MTIIRAPRPSVGYSLVSNAVARDMRLTRRARGLLVEMLSHTDGWHTDAASLAQAGVEGRAAILSMLKELRKFRYVVQVKSQNAKGHWSTTTYLFDQPATDEDVAAMIAGPDPDPDEVTEHDAPPNPPMPKVKKPEFGNRTPVHQHPVSATLKALEVPGENDQSLSPDQRLVAQLLGLPGDDERLESVPKMLNDNGVKNPRAWLRACGANGDLEDRLTEAHSTTGAHTRHADAVEALRCDHGKVNGHITCPDCTDALVSP